MSVRCNPCLFRKVEIKGQILASNYRIGKVFHYSYNPIYLYSNGVCSYYVCLYVLTLLKLLKSNKVKFSL